MNKTITTALLAAVFLTFGSRQPRAQNKPEIVETKRIWESAPRGKFCDLIRFRDRWYCTFEGANGDVLVIRSEDGKSWKSVAAMAVPSPRRGNRDPLLSLTAKGHLQLAAPRSFPKSSRQTMLWVSKLGEQWSRPKKLLEDDFVHTSMRRHLGAVYTFGYGCTCGKAMTVQFLRDESGERFQKLYDETFSFFPGSAALVFDRDRGYCLMGRGNQTGLLGKSGKSNDSWVWTELPTRFSDPNAICLPDRRIVAAVGRLEPRARTALCWFDPKTGKLEEFLTLPIAGTARVGLVHHDEHLWVSFQAATEGGVGVHLAKVKLAN